jgi:hypothetical protein
VAVRTFHQLFNTVAGNQLDEPKLFIYFFLCLKSSHNEDLASNRRPWGYEDQEDPST